MQRIVKPIDGPVSDGYGKVLASCTFKYGEISDTSDCTVIGTFL